MKPAFKVIVASAIVCIIGAAVKDFGAETLGSTMLILGAVGIIFGPMAQDL